MAVTKLALYNNALITLGQRVLSSESEAREPRYVLDAIWNMGAVDYCLELVKPRFATRTSKLTSSTASSQHDLDNVYSLPSDYIATVGVYSDAELTQEITRFIVEGSTLACDYATVYLRHVYSGASYATWPASFAQVVSAYLASRAAVKIDPTKLEAATVTFTEATKAAIALEEERESKDRSPQITGTLTATWRHIYNDALLILGQEKLTTGTEDTLARTVLDTVVDAQVIEDMLEETGWIFALTSNKITYDPSAEASFGYTRAHAIPTTMHRLDGIYQDERMQSPLRDYKEEEQYWHCDLDTIYVQYVDNTYLSSPNLWPAYFRRLVAAKLAKDAAPRLRGQGADLVLAESEYRARRYEALNNSAVASPPKILAIGNWVGARWRQGYRGRP